MKIWQLTNLLGNDELTTCNKNGQEVFEDGFNWCNRKVKN